jgi:hypothetical protein
MNIVELPVNIKGVIVGLLLSDAWMEKRKSDYSSARFFFKQSFLRIEYLLSVFWSLSHYCKSIPKLGYAKLKNKKFPFLAFNTRNLFCLTEFYNIFYKNGKKSLPDNIFDLFTIQSLVHWICGNGSYVKGGGLYLNTQSFSIIDNVRLINLLMIKYGCKCTLHYQRGLPLIYISARSIRKLSPILGPIIVPSIRYKLHGNKGNTN